MPRKLVGRYEILQPSGITYPILQQLFLDIARREAGSFPRKGCQAGDENLQTEGGALVGRLEVRCILQEALYLLYFVIL